MALPIVLVYYSYFQVFADGIMLLCLLLYLLIISAKDWHKSIIAYIGIIVVIVIGFFAKAYTLPFFILHFTLIHIFKFKQGQPFSLPKYLSTLLIIIAFLIPWGIQLNQKYGNFSIMGNAGKLNMSWYIMSGKTFKPSIKLLIPPTYPNSPSFWEDPYFSQGAFYSPTSSLHHFVKWIARVIYTFFQAILCYAELSVLLIPVLFLAWYFVLKNNKENFALFSLWLAAVIIPLGYLTMHIESRYIWLAQIVGIVFSGILINKLLTIKSQIFATLLVAICLLAYPIYNLEALRNKGKSNFELATMLEKNNIKNAKIISNNTDAGNMWVACYLSNNQFYTIENFNYTPTQLSTEITQYKIQYYILAKDGSCSSLQIPNYTSTLIAENNNYIVYSLIANF
jgi:hypothetical protein